jgi:hypothetical protein
VFFFHIWRRIITTILIASGSAWGACRICMSLRQYTTNIPIIVKGRISARYLIYLGMGLFSGKRRKGRALVNKVPNAIMIKNRMS